MHQHGDSSVTVHLFWIVLICFILVVNEAFVIVDAGINDRLPRRRGNPGLPVKNLTDKACLYQGASLLRSDRQPLHYVP